MSFDPSSLNFVEVHGVLSSLILGSPLLNGGPLQIVKPPESLTRMSSDGGFATAIDDCESFSEIRVQQFIIQVQIFSVEIVWTQFGKIY